MIFPPCLFGERALRFSPTIGAYYATDKNDQEYDGDTDKITITADSIWVSPTPLVKPSTAMYHSLAFPGWGQLNNGRKKKAALFFIAEAIFIGGYIYKTHDIKNGDYTDWEKDNLRTDRNTFLLYWMISKILGIIDAYVDAQLADYNVKDITPEELKKE